MIKLAYKIAWSFHKTTGVSVEELISEATLALLEAQITYDPDKAMESTYYYHCIKNALCAFVQQESRLVLPGFSIPDGVTFQPEMDSIKDIVAQWKPDCRLVVELILKTPKRYCELKPKMARGRIVRLLRRQGWSWPRIWATFKEVKLALNETPEFSII